MENPKEIRLSAHARVQAILRGASEEQIAAAIRSAPWSPALKGKFEAKLRFEFGGVSPMNQKTYRFKTIEPVFADEADAIVVVTVKVYYSNEE